MRRLVLVAILAALATFYYRAATEHAATLNTQRGRADQSGYLWDAVGIHMMRHGSPEALIGERNRMPVYPWLLSWLYDGSMTQETFFEVAKRFNIRLSLVLLALIALVASRFLPPLVLANFVLILAFGYFVFKAGYAQVELLYYTLFFFAFVACCLLLRAATMGQAIVLAVVAGALVALTHLTKAAALPLAAIAFAVASGRAAGALIAAGRNRRAFAVRAVAALLFIATFLGVMSPYLRNSKRVFGHYFYNVNTTFYIWYEDWTAASWGVYRHGDGVGWPTVPPNEIPSMRKYLREHSAGRIATRLRNGFFEIFTVSYTRLWYFKFVAIYILFGVALLSANRRAFMSLARSRLALFIFLVLYAGAYIVGVSFYQPISGTTLRMLLAHVAPLLFVLSALCVREPFRHTLWNVAGLEVGPQHFMMMVAVTMGLDVMFAIWPRIMRDFAGY